MRLEWDENKRLINLRKHGFDFADATQVFENARYEIIDDRFDYGEIRFLTYGLINGRVAAVSHTLGDDIFRIISIRKANKNEQAKFFKNIAD